MALLTSVLNDDPHKHPLLILQSSLAQTSLSIVRHVLAAGSSGSTRRNVLFCLLYPPSSLIDSKILDVVEVYDWTDHVPGYHDLDTRSEILAIVEKLFYSAPFSVVEGSSDPLNIVIDSADTLVEDDSSPSKTYKFLSTLYEVVKRHKHSRLIIHSQSPSNLLPLITQTSFSSSLAHVITHPTALIAHLAIDFLMPPPPLSPLPKFWSVFIPVSERIHDTERLVFGTGGEGSGYPSEFVVEVIVREGVGRKRGVERILEAWSSTLEGPCELTVLESLKKYAEKPKEYAQSAAPDPTQNLSFNLNLTTSQQESRAQVPLPYTHDGKPIISNPPAAIFYDPDSADDLDDDDPDEDLDI
ncbi:hypothetical protein CPB84DRAFT_1670900 [Gymnopilus junonius]|uniref:Elongator complex protein 5 n=1 Tax=Gymnopilus junonius TaxID=109634 RepID=A0A9P5P1S4_GYMJU|nr:hypothetical protein CPB84DRAFT_1670900 [Gymnopilus junonius]